MISGKLIEVGKLTTKTEDEECHYEYAMLVEFDSVDQLRAAMEEKKIEITWGD